MESILLIVRSVTQAQLMERALWKAGIRASISRTPMELTANSGCTYAVRIAAEDLAAAIQMINGTGLRPAGIYASDSLGYREVAP
ncbi:DUF3343 domain-containing protein [Dysosmobacter sp.]|uniref:DUF3343 domain-containing protein n=1 Tax=Dysosmobacter sp. TaxID=2591382 RepID=UPI002A8ABC57|nr:DUF3343 domain-containing protein [Dysosmobacter sp.]MDY3282380.1 DUF3343 domain-containing protein [Dysosmobacter sp.]